MRPAIKNPLTPKIQIFKDFDVLVGVGSGVKFIGFSPIGSKSSIFIFVYVFIKSLYFTGFGLFLQSGSGVNTDRYARIAS